MKTVDRFLNILKLNEDEDMRDDDYLDEEDDYAEDSQPGRRMIRSVRNDEDEDDEEEEDRSTSSRKISTTSSSRQRVSRMPGAGRISPIRSRSAFRDDGSLAVCVIRPHSMEDAQEITDTLLSGCAVILNAEGIELELAQRIIDFASGSCYAMDGNLQKISNYIFIITPSSVDISGDFQDLISGAFDVPFGSRF